tara:strand:+ start:4037 stop:4807 length:771 start_codon:yes stop_codon:yes gene_type:complete
MENYTTEAEANSNETSVVDAVVGTEENNPFADDNSVQSQGYNNIPEQSTESTTTHVDWENESKKWQSMYDKSQTSLTKLEGALETAVQMQNNNTAVNQQQEQVPQVSEEEFNPWDAYYKPESPSYKMRVSQEQNSVQSAIEGHMNKMNENIALNNTINELKNVHKMPDEEVKDFLQFVTQPRENVGLDNLVKLWSDVNGKKRQQGVYDSLEAVKQSRKTPVSPGSIQGADPRTRPKNESETAWEGIMGAAQHGRLP